MTAAESNAQRSAPDAGAIFSVLEIERLHNRGRVPIAVLVLDVEADELYARFRDDLADIADEEALEVLEGMEQMIVARAREEGACRLFEWFADTLSGYVRMREPCVLPVPINWKSAADGLFVEHVSGR
jgi:hypothetical protein